MKKLFDEKNKFLYIDINYARTHAHTTCVRAHLHTDTIKPI